jgi:hypothetical protein
MRKTENSNELDSRKHLREFVTSVINKDYAHANANLAAAIKEKIKSQVANILEENP